ncbi:MAG: hypothetical protein A2563_03840 [Candidatus Magasanikbacteria bacterium RIFOXYD1_FULL_40_23]|uniref:Uncharacterized protein n=1 Tax=Candidatus Magasanikbacteria bacterium RIFOXYD1_FULL_40_23 TaxID=1798705 RepID=A0A1F6P9Y9_9BACT|nr:MAG: hypothetical protein A2563_03840 [Candidatus Magasanikbacteria bacterium RIFOXYD1_FULL_40_23]
MFAQGRRIVDGDSELLRGLAQNLLGLVHVADPVRTSEQAVVLVEPHGGTAATAAHEHDDVLVVTDHACDLLVTSAAEDQDHVHDGHHLRYALEALDEQVVVAEGFGQVGGRDRAADERRNALLLVAGRGLVHDERHDRARLARAEGRALGRLLDPFAEELDVGVNAVGALVTAAPLVLAVLEFDTILHVSILLSFCASPEHRCVIAGEITYEFLRLFSQQKNVKNDVY